MGQDTLSEVLRGVRLRGAVFYHVEGEAPWVAEAPPAADIAQAIMPGAGHVMEFHVVTRGDGWAALLGESPVRLQAGDTKEAVRLARRGLALEPASELSPLGHYVLADVYRGRGQAAQAAAELARGRRLEAAASAGSASGSETDRGDTTFGGTGGHRDR